MYDAKSEYEEFWEEINSGTTPDNAKGQEILASLSDALVTGGIEKYKETFDDLTDVEKKWVAQNSDTAKSIGATKDDLVDAADAVEGFGDEIRRLQMLDL